MHRGKLTDTKNHTRYLKVKIIKLKLSEGIYFKLISTVNFLNFFAYSDTEKSNLT